MAGQNDFLPFAIGGGANVISQADYAVLAALSTGFVSGTAVSEQLNKVWRQSATMSCVVAAFIISQLPTADVLDNGDPAAIVALLAAAIQQAAITGPAPVVVTDGADFATDPAVNYYAFNRTTGLVALQTITLDAGIPLGTGVKFQDVKGNAQANKIKIVPPSGSIAGLPFFTMNEDRQTTTITPVAVGIYGVE